MVFVLGCQYCHVNAIHYRLSSLALSMSMRCCPATLQVIIHSKVILRNQSRLIKMFFKIKVRNADPPYPYQSLKISQKLAPLLCISRSPECECCLLLTPQRYRRLHPNDDYHSGQHPNAVAYHYSNEDHHGYFHHHRATHHNRNYHQNQPTKPLRNFGILQIHQLHDHELRNLGCGKDLLHGSRQVR